MRYRVRSAVRCLFLLGVPPHADGSAASLFEEANEPGVIWPARLPVEAPPPYATEEQDARPARRVLHDRPGEDLFRILKIGPVAPESVAWLNDGHDAWSGVVGDVQRLKCSHSIRAQVEKTEALWSVGDRCFLAPL